MRDLILICEPRRGFRQAAIIVRRTKVEFAQSMKQIADIYPGASVIRVVEDNLNTNKRGFLYEAFSVEEARLQARQSRRIMDEITLRRS